MDGAIEVGATGQGVGNRGRRCPDFGNDISGGGPVSLSVWVGYVGDDTAHWKVFGDIPPQGVPQADGTAITEGEGRGVGVYPSVREN